MMQCLLCIDIEQSWKRTERKVMFIAALVAIMFPSLHSEPGLKTQGSQQSVMF